MYLLSRECSKPPTRGEQYNRDTKRCINYNINTKRPKKEKTSQELTKYPKMNQTLHQTQPLANSQTDEEAKEV